MRLRHLTVAAAALIPALLTPTVAEAAPGRANGPALPHHLTWTPFRTQPFTVPAGLACPFELRGDVLRDEEQIATLDTFADGSPRVQVIVGDLTIRYSNTSTGASVDEDLDGVGVLDNGADGSQTFRLFGPAAVGFRPTDPYPAGFWVLDGYHEVYTAPQRAYREMRVDGGSEHNVCDDLG